MKNAFERKKIRGALTGAQLHPHQSESSDEHIANVRKNFSPYDPFQNAVVRDPSDGEPWCWHCSEGLLQGERPPPCHNKLCKYYRELKPGETREYAEYSSSSHSKHMSFANWQRYKLDIENMHEGDWLMASDYWHK